MNIWNDLEQRTEQWFKVRAGRPTASNFDRIITPTGNDSSQWSSYAIELCASCLRPDEIAWEGNRHTDRGEELEPKARDLFTELTGLDVRQVGFVTRDDGIVGCSPDALIYDGDEIVAGLELKCPLAKNHAAYLLAGVLPPEYKPQVHGSMAVTGLDEWWFMSYCPGLAPFKLKVERDEFTEKVSDALDRFLIFYAAERKRIIPIIEAKPTKAKR